MRTAIIMVGVIAVGCAAIGADGAEPLSVYSNASLGQNFMGGLDYLPDGDIIGMYTDPDLAKNAYIGIIDGNRDGIPDRVRRVHEFGRPTLGIAVRVSPDGLRVLFGDRLASPTSKLFLMDLSDYNVTEIMPAGGTFQGAYDIAFIDDGHCYISANPGLSTATINKIFHLDLASGRLTELVSIDDTFAGPIDTDSGGNLYYVRGKGNNPVQPGDFTLLRFAAANLENALLESSILGATDAEVIAGGLDGGQDVAWHSSGALFVADANNGAIYEVAASGAVSDYAVRPGRFGEGFWFLALDRRDCPLRAPAEETTEIAAEYRPLPGAGDPDVTRVSPEIDTGERLLLTVAISETMPVPFDAYVVLSGAGAFYSLTSRGLTKGIEPYAKDVPALTRPVEKTVLDLLIPEHVPLGIWTIYAALSPKSSAESLSTELVLDSIEVTVK